MQNKDYHSLFECLGVLLVPQTLVTPFCKQFGNNFDKLWRGYKTFRPRLTKYYRGCVPGIPGGVDAYARAMWICLRHAEIICMRFNTTTWTTCAYRAHLDIWTVSPRIYRKSEVRRCIYCHFVSKCLNYQMVFQPAITLGLSFYRFSSLLNISAKLRLWHSVGSYVLFKISPLYENWQSCAVLNVSTLSFSALGISHVLWLSVTFYVLKLEIKGLSTALLMMFENLPEHVLISSRPTGISWFWIALYFNVRIRLKYPC